MPVLAFKQPLLNLLDCPIRFVLVGYGFYLLHIYNNALSPLLPSIELRAPAATDSLSTISNE